MHKYSNHLLGETSPYLLQHAHNPVDWHPWGEEALRKAKEEDKPILVSIGYAACHWCHVMERESFEDEATAALMNEHFINVKVDREERPDLDHIYMDAVQAITGGGGWPLNVFLTPDAKPFYGGTYFPPKRVHNRASWKEVLEAITTAYREKRDDINAQAEGLTGHLLQSNSFGLQEAVPDDLFSKARFGEAIVNVLKQADTRWGGFGQAPKFPQTFTIQLLLRNSFLHRSGNTGKEDPEFSEMTESGLTQAMLSLDKMIDGGIYDQIGGGFARYSTDTEWLAPHFEKMLYDNALLVSVLSEAYQLTGRVRYREVIEETMAFVQRELMHGEGGFYAALDADSEGREGKYYVWRKEEVTGLLGPEMAVPFCSYYDISEKGNWEDIHGPEPGTNILRVTRPAGEVATSCGISIEQLQHLLANGRQKLMQARSSRVRPGLDDKVILGWNALMNTAFSKAFIATGKEEYREVALRNMRFLLANLGAGQPGELFHTWKNGQAKYPAFLDDYAFLVEALIFLQEITGDRQWLRKAYEYMRFILEYFGEDETGYFFYTKRGQADVIVRKKEVYDGAVPSGNSVMAYNLYRLSLLMDRPEWKERSFGMIRSIGQTAVRYPTSFGIWACLLQEIIYGTLEVAVVGEGSEELVGDIYRFYVPNRVLMRADIGDEEWPILANKPGGKTPLIFLCKGYVCKQPVDSVERFMSLINSGENRN